MKRSLKRDTVRKMWLCIFAFYLSFSFLILYAFVLLTSFALLSTLAYLSFSAQRWPLVSVISAVWGNERTVFISPCPLRRCRFGAVCNRQRGKNRLYSFTALGTWSWNPWSMQGRGGRKKIQRHRPRGVIQWDWDAEKERIENVTRREADRQTGR